jgi:hypothetical protein
MESDGGIFDNSPYAPVFLSSRGLLSASAARTPPMLELTRNRHANPALKEKINGAKTFRIWEEIFTT